MTFLASFVLVGLALQAAALRWPVRRFDEPMEAGIDAVALLVALGCQLAIPFVAFPWISSIQHWPAVAAGYHALRTLPPVAAGLFWFLTVDFLAYWMHRLNHAPWLWSTHAFHHSARNLQWASGMRGSPVHFVLLGIPSLLVQVVFEPEGSVAALVMLYGVAHNSLIHSNVRIPGRLLNQVFVTGRSHFVHHGRDPRLGHANFGFLFTFWDRLFGTWVDPDSLPADFPLGIEEGTSTLRLVLGLPPARPR